MTPKLLVPVALYLAYIVCSSEALVYTLVVFIALTLGSVKQLIQQQNEDPWALDLRREEQARLHEAVRFCLHTSYTPNGGYGKVLGLMISNDFSTISSEYSDKMRDWAQGYSDSEVEDESPVGPVLRKTAHIVEKATKRGAAEVAGAVKIAKGYYRSKLKPDSST